METGLKKRHEARPEKTLRGHALKKVMRAYARPQKTLLSEASKNV